MMMLTRIGSTISASEGTLAGDILWLGASAFVFSVVIGDRGLSWPAPRWKSRL
jgi:hypothetical protein